MSTAFAYDELYAEGQSVPRGSAELHWIDGQNWWWDAFDFSNARGGGGGPGGGKPSGDAGGEPVLTGTYLSGQDDGAAGYDIAIEFYDDGWTPELMQAFVDAADFLSTLITNDRPDYIAADDPNQFFSYDIDDILIKATLTNIDGVGGVLGQAGPTHLIIDDGETIEDALPFAGVMEFDLADAQAYYDQGLWYDIVLHEMLHTIGLGSMWETQGLVETTIDDNGTRKPTDDIITTTYLGEALDADGNVPVIEDDGGPGTAGVHWDEDTYDNELMTGYIDNANYISDMTYAALIDLGYEINPIFYQPDIAIA